MSTFDRRAFVISTAAAAVSTPFAASADDQSTLVGAGQQDIERFLTLQEGALQERATASALLALKKAPRKPLNLSDRILMWNEISLDTNALDYVPPINGSPFHQQFGPHKSSRAIAVVQIAVFEAVNALKAEFKSYSGFSTTETQWSVDAAVAQASHDVLVNQYPPQSSRLDLILADDLTKIPDSPAKIDAGRKVGSEAFASVKSRLANDNTGLKEPSIPADYQPGHAVGEWDVDPVSKIMVALGGNWSKVTPFTFSDASQFRAPEPPAVGSAAYVAAFKKTKSLGGDPKQGTKSARTDDDTFYSKFWSYDGTPGLCAPPRLYNQISRQLALSSGITDPVKLARFLAIINVGMADAAVSCWEAKYHYKYWRPVTAIRAKESIDHDEKWYPLGAQATNTAGPNITPPFPAYPSGHATFGGALFEILRSYMPDKTKFSFVSDEFNGKNKDVYGVIRPKRTAHFQSLTDAERSNAESRIWNGVHWQFDGDEGIAQGKRVARNVLTTFAQKS